MNTSKPDEHTRPWSADEMILVNGRPFVYSTGSHGPVVHFYGGASEPAADLITRGNAVVMPCRQR